MERSLERLNEREENRAVPDAQRVVIFVHGFGGDYRKTWGNLPDYMSSDVRFDNTDLYLFGFDSGPFSYFSPSIYSIGERLRTILAFDFKGKYDSVSIISHSMGGLVTKHAVASALQNGDAESIQHLHHVVFCSTPHLGEVKASAFGGLARHLLELRALRPQLISLHSTWQSRVNPPNDADADIIHERYTARFCISNVWGQSDKVVTQANACVVSSERLPIIIPGSHRSMIKPDSMTDVKYRALSKLLAGELEIPPRLFPSDRVITASMSLCDAGLQLSDTKGIPLCFESLCRKVGRN